jgi:hypothetical protein
MPDLPVITAPFSSAQVRQAVAALSGNERLDLTGRPEFAALAEDVLAALAIPPAACVVRGTRFDELPGELAKSYVAALAELFGKVSDGNVDSEHSGVFADEVRPSDPGSKDVTYQMGACEAHADESSKVRPEDVVALWCLRPAAWGGDSLLWTAADLATEISGVEGGDKLVRTLRTADFYFGGKLRQPPRLVRAPILFGADGIRFRLGSIMDAAEVAGRPLTDAQEAALKALIRATETVDPYRYALRAGDALIWMNRKAIHSRSDFDDTSRLLLRTRCFNERLSNSDDDEAEWDTATVL